ncbi:prepilin-type N-terminal cleavage/methylation domain-containing protein [Shewanella aquimarina]|uniref:prepilin-type N-terminal cleavage/methylation domain-containing protein n=1 Tax=Shewanella aquimarina TaxID=260365 RepID=UPI002014B8E6|nr:prepilin-type N-terminal cleavage/methylation domain-containing protein [Shewanella aquimarina]MCL2909581.1 prepilin-type N-terminal cleavage/methylation domain-containing protein [Shewanella aquimarina]
MRKISGFTLIELVVVIVVLAILAVVALPRFVSLRQDAHDSAAKGAFSAFTSGVSLYHSCWAASGASGQVVDLACFGDGTIDSTTTGYPLGKTTQTGGNNGTQLQGDFCRQLWEGLLDNSDHQLASHDDASFGGSTDIIYWYSGGDLSLSNTYCYFNYIRDNREKGNENWQLRYYPATGKTLITRSTLS